MQERLIEYWLDRVNERAYQPAFLQMLSGEGHRVIHSTRHMPIEFGKDVISIAADGTPCAFQLKGNPGGRLTLSQLREIQPQITELVEQPIVYPGIPRAPHRCYLVTNGEVDEEVLRAVDDLNRGYEARGFAEETRLSIISRGTLLDWAIRHSSTFWPSDFSIHEKLIRLYNESGRSPLDLGVLHEGLAALLNINSPTKLKEQEFVRRSISASIFVSLALQQYAKERNHIEFAAAFSALFSALCGAADKHDHRRNVDFLRSLQLAREGFLDSCADLANDIGERLKELRDSRPELTDRNSNAVFLSGGALADHFLWRVRALRTIALLSVLEIHRRRSSSRIELTPAAEDAISVFTKPGQVKFEVWGEAAVPQLLSYIFFLRVTSATNQPDILLAELVQAITRRVLTGGYIASPYHSAEEAVRDSIGEALGISRGEVEKETLRGSSYFVLPLFHCFVRSNLKSRAKALWSGITRISHNRFAPEHPWDFCLWRAENGLNETRQLPMRGEWALIQEEAADIDLPYVPSAMRDDPLMLLAFTNFFPHRATPEVVRYLHFAICRTWFLPFPAPEVPPPS